MTIKPQCSSNICMQRHVKFWSKISQLHYFGCHPSAADFDKWLHKETLLTTLLHDSEAEKGFLQTCTQQSKVFLQWPRRSRSIFKLHENTYICVDQDF